MEDFILQMKNITKQFPGVVALDNVSLEVVRGEILALVGENGAGKSTLMKILSGVYPYGTYLGKILMNGKEVRFHSTRDSQHKGISIIYQELELIEHLNVAENIFLGRLHNSLGIVDWDKVYYEARKILEYIGVEIDLTERIGNIGVGHQQLVEIAKAISVNADLLILDEPTAALTESEVDLLMAILRRLKEKGVTCILISHKLNEVMRIADRVTVLRDGRVIGTEPVSSLTEDKIITMMVGRELTQLYPEKKCQIGKTVLEVKDFNKWNLEGKAILRNINLQVRAGEILGIAGLMGAGRTELLMSLFGFLPGPKEGSIYIEGNEVEIETPEDAIRAGIGLVPEDRKLLGLILIQSVVNNITLSSLKKVSFKGILSVDKEVHLAQKYVESLGIKTPTVETIVNTLSGGNQQKVLLARSLLTDPKVLLLDEPTRGIDVGAKYEIYTLMNQLASNGAAIVMVSSEMPELIGMCDRIMVMHEGELVGEFTRSEVTQEKIMLKASGSTKEN